MSSWLTVGGDGPPLLGASEAERLGMRQDAAFRRSIEMTVELFAERFEVGSDEGERRVRLAACGERLRG